jgi:SAM-dependent methyltransferase
MTAVDDLRLFVVDNFTPDILSEVAKVQHTLNGPGLFIPTNELLWRRCINFSERTAGQYQLSPHWEDQKSGFLYVYSLTQKCLLAAGLFNNAYVSWDTDIRHHATKQGEARQQQTQLFELFSKEMGPLVRSWYPILPSMIEYNELAKNLDIARVIARLVGDETTPVRILEIGAGGCLLALFLRKLLSIARYEVIDLKLMMPLGAALLAFFDPDAAVELPGESNPDAWLHYQLPTDIQVEPASVDVAINVNSFQEMTNEMVGSYFSNIARALKPGGLFVCINRQSKSTTFDEYPWDLIRGEVLVDEEDLSSRFFRDTQIVRRRIVRRADETNQVTVPAV